jgi:hypothetical protein
MSRARGLAAHLRVYADLGVDGISRDPAWRERAAAAEDTGYRNTRYL